MGCVNIPYQKMLNYRCSGTRVFNDLDNTVYTLPSVNLSNSQIKEKDLFDLYSEFSKLSDTRRAQGKRHGIQLVLMIVTLGIMNGYDGYRALADFVERNRQSLISNFKPNKNRLPSLWTIMRVMVMTDFNELCHILEEWAKHHVIVAEKDWVSLDGKAIKGTFPEKMHKFVNLVSLFALNKKQVLSVGKVDYKSNEIPKVQELIEKFPAKNVVYRMDAMHCQQKTIKYILKNDSHYVLEAKQNQKKLLKKVKFIAEYLPAISSDVMKEKNRGRIEIRKATVHRECLDLEYYGWEGIKFIVKVERIVRYKSGKTSNEIAYFITNLEEKASFFNKGIRDHWKIENSLHYVKDVTFNEDRLKIRTGNAPQNMSLLRTLVINIFRNKGFSNIVQATRLLSGNIPAMLALVI